MDGRHTLRPGRIAAPVRRRAVRPSGPAADLRRVHATLIAGADRRVHSRGCGRWRGPRLTHLGARHELSWEPCVGDCPWPEPEPEEMPLATRGSRLSRWLTLALLIMIPIVSSLWNVLRPTDAAATACPPGQVTMAAAGGDVSASLEPNGAAGSVLLRLCTTGGVISSWTASATPRAGGTAVPFQVARVGEGTAVGTAALPAGQEWLLAVELVTEGGERRAASSYISS
ncbi:hypothetical protein [Catenuloplanes atrovinosus]|uniref:Uncharacterized protein n=1 Tax=Catenuloplanes atrovinosus TaxID=137266 RepID=A0AAE3YMB4_9ACTN|nr:hypothetical protein [Catenuloplanes atrovinosus]MDR7274818.1 hypothetical protein [Catenuloplanes atrovinosus]